MNKKICFALLIILIIAGCSSAPVQVATIHIKGSDTMLLLTERLAEKYMQEHRGISIYVEGGGSASGIRALSNGLIDICCASRGLNASEAKILADHFGSLGLSFLIAKDALSIYLNENNPVKNLTIEQLRGIFTCKIKNWKELGGDDAPISPITRTPNSGTYLYFKEHVLSEDDYCNDLSSKATTDEVVKEVESNKYAIGYGGIGFKDGIVHASVNGIVPTVANVINDKYPISRYLHFYTLDTPKGAVRDFIDWVVGPEGQQIVEESGYIPLWQVPY